MKSGYVAERLEGRRLMASGVLDSSFGTNGVLSGYSEVFPGGVAHAVVVQPDGRILVAGGSGQDSQQPGLPVQTLTSNFAIVRLLADGSQDAGFGTGGFETPAPVPFCSVRAIALQADGKIIAAGAGGDNGSGAPLHIIVERFNTNGTPDSTFGTGGFVSAAFGDDEMATSVSVQPDGKILILGDATSVTGSSVIVVRYDGNGSLDPSFGTSGVARILPNSTSAGLVLQKDGKIVIASEGAPLVERLTSSGIPDATFGTAGVAQSPFQIGLFPAAIGVQADGRVVIAGTGMVEATSYSDIVAVRFTASGLADRSFGRGGITSVTLPDHSGADPHYFAQNANAQAAALVVQKDGRIVIGGAVAQIGADLHGLDPHRFAAVRLTASGRLDSSFGSGGTVQIGTGNVWPTDANTATAVALSPEGSIVLAGNTEFGNIDTGLGGGDIPAGFGVLRLSRAGKLDTRFGYQGRVGPFPIAPPAEQVALQGDGKVILGTQHGLARLNADGKLDPSFGKGGMTLMSGDFIDDYADNIRRTLESLTVLKDGSILAAYSVTLNYLYGTSGTSPSYVELRRFHSDGSVDTAFGIRRLAKTKITTTSNSLWALAVQPDGKIVVASATGSGNVIITRYLPNGASDRAFGSGGAAVLMPFGAVGVSISRIAFDDAGGMNLGGTGQITSATDPNKQQYELVLAYLDSHGRLYPDLSSPANAPRALAGYGQLVDMVSDGDGGVFTLTQDDRGLVLSLYGALGTLDLSFGNQGSLTLDPPAGSPDGPMFIGADGSVSGLLANGSVVRFLSSGTLDDSFGVNGVATLPVGPSVVAARAPDGALVFSVIDDSLEEADQTMIVRITA